MSFIENLWQIFLEAAPYLMVGFVVAGILHQYLPAQFVQKHLGGSSWGNIFKASLIGTPVPLCSCGVVPVGLGLHRDGASKPTVISFLISTPENGVESISLTYSFFGLPLTIIRIVFAIVVANLTALTVALFEKRTDQPNSEKSVSCCSSESAPLKSCCGGIGQLMLRLTSRNPGELLLHPDTGQAVKLLLRLRAQSRQRASKRFPVRSRRLCTEYRPLALDRLPHLSGHHHLLARRSADPTRPEMGGTAGRTHRDPDVRLRQRLHADRL